MDAIDNILKRRSVRKFTDAKIPEQDIECILKAAMHAPSAKNQQPWQFIVLDDKSLIEKIPSFSPYAYMCVEAPISVLICGDLKLEQSKDYWPVDCAAATQNLLLASHAKGLGSVWAGVYPREKIMKGFTDLLHLPEHIIPFALVVIGYAKEEPKYDERFKKDRIHKNMWS